ncbi:Ribosomal large subunit pseudouridine synthase D [Acaryochloris thomasi RCC1774]|uniref:Pseudouridine synthase n=1 Tax=Acaryochloris thomasi RCC1774 TaxID=1764569 RepID=A0A2W1JLY6_9CYAN|nr:RluA family pseudouridine synthase [Acaryochloris thomasi]PZD74226.1 Ribosomal large subunit pseudouridine synthase D [Acaryochloris thomasi RCC1774]
MTEFCYRLTEDSGQRLDRWLAGQSEISRSHLQRLIEQGHVQVNQQVCQSKKHLLQVGDQVLVTLPEPEPLSLEPEAIPLDILYEDDHFLIVNKPVGLVVHPAPGHATGTLVHALLAHCQKPDGTTSLSGIGGVERPGIVHRLDKDTTGVIAIAKTDQAHHHLQAQIAARTAKREYLAVVYGQPSTDSGKIDRPIGRHPVDRIKMAIIPEEEGGRSAVTHWQVRERLGNYALMHFQLETGRTHQIRVHCADQGWPIIGDPLYSRGKSVGVNLPGQALHAWQLTLQHPVTVEEIQVQAPLPETFAKLLRRLKIYMDGL